MHQDRNCKVQKKKEKKRGIKVQYKENKLAAQHIAIENRIATLHPYLVEKGSICLPSPFIWIMNFQVQIWAGLHDK